MHAASFPFKSGYSCVRLGHKPRSASFATEQAYRCKQVTRPHPSRTRRDSNHRIIRMLLSLSPKAQLRSWARQSLYVCEPIRTNERLTIYQGWGMGGNSRPHQKPYRHDGRGGGRERVAAVEAMAAEVMAAARRAAAVGKIVAEATAAVLGMAAAYSCCDALGWHYTCHAGHLRFRAAAAAQSHRPSCPSSHLQAVAAGACHHTLTPAASSCVALLSGPDSQTVTSTSVARHLRVYCKCQDEERRQLAGRPATHCPRATTC